MEFIDGETLDALVRRQGPLPVGTALRLALQAARALAAAARQNLVHRDIKPANLMVVHEDADEHMVIKVIDFGLARPVAGDDDGDGSFAGALTMHGFVGTPQYASPEQLEERTLDARSDIYSLGVTLWFLLTGKPPFTGSLAGIIQQHLSKAPPWPQLPASITEDVRQLLGHMLEKNPAKRPQTAVDLRHEIEACLAALHTPAPAPVSPADAPVAAETGATGGGLMSKFFSGFNRPREAAGSTAPAETGSDIEHSGSPSTQPNARTIPEAGTLIADRFELFRLVGEGGTGRVFEARDRAGDNRTVAVKILRPGIGGADDEARNRLRDDARQVCATPHPNLIELVAFEPAPNTDDAPPGHVAEEWLRGFSLRDLLAARNGALPVVECLRLLKQAASAVDHAASRRLEHLELGLHQIQLHFPVDRAPAVEAVDPRALLQMSLEEWPEWVLKVEPFSLRDEAGELNTWMGEVTLFPGTPRHAPGDARDEGASLAAAYTHALARIACELLGGQPPGSHAASAKYVSLPTLNEAGNAVLARALREAGGFESASGFHENLARAAGFSADSLIPGTAHPSESFLPAMVARTNRAHDSSAALTRTKPAGGLGTVDLTRQVAASAVDLPPRQAPLISRKHDDSSSTTDPWKESQFARLLEEEEKRQLVDPGSTGFALTVGAALGLLLLVIGFGVTVWHRGGFAVSSTKDAARPPAVAARHTGTRKENPSPQPRPTRPPATASAATAATPAPLAAASASAALRPDSPALPTQAAPQTASLPPAPLPSTASPPPTPESAAAESPATAEIQSGQVVLTAEQARSRPNPTPRFDDRTISVEIRSEPPGADIFLQEASLGRTPVKVSLAPGDYQFVAHYRGWPEVRQDVHLAAEQTEMTTDIHLISPSQLPVAAGSSPVLETPRRRRRENPTSASNDETNPAALTTPGEKLRIYRAKPVPADNPASGEPLPAVPTVRRALPVPEPFLKSRDNPVNQSPDAPGE